MYKCYGNLNENSMTSSQRWWDEWQAPQEHTAELTLLPVGQGWGKQSGVKSTQPLTALPWWRHPGGCGAGAVQKCPACPGTSRELRQHRAPDLSSVTSLPPHLFELHPSQCRVNNLTPTLRPPFPWSGTSLTVSTQHTGDSTQRANCFASSSPAAGASWRESA